MSISKLRDLEHLVTDIKDLDATKKELIIRIKNMPLPSKDQMKLLMNIATCITVVDLQKLFYNSLLKYEGLGVV